MPVSSHQIGGLIGGQQAMFGNFASYSRQISPYGQQGPMPTYSNPMAGMGEMMQPPPAPHNEMQQMAERFGVGAVGMLGHVPSAIGTMGLVGGIGGLMGSRALGAVGTAASTFDPFSAAIGGFGRGIGWQSGAGIGANLGRLGSMGIGGIARAGMAGLGGAAVAAAPAMLLTEGVRYAAGQMVQGAQFQNQVGNVLQQQFRFMRPGGGGYGFGTEERHGISDMLRQMGHQEMMSTPSEMLRLLQQGAGMGMFKAVSDAKEFRKKFQEMVGTLKEVAKTMNTTLEGAMPFLGQARQMGFWTPQDVLRNATQTRAVSAVTGMSAAQVQGMMMQGAQMSRAIGAEGARGARGMARSLEWAGAAVGGPGRRGIMSEELVSEITGGMQGPEATQAMAGQLQSAATHFAASGRARWVLAALGTDRYSRLDPARLRELREGRMGLGAIGGGARSGIARQGAANFVMNEERLRGELLEQGPEAQLGFIRSIIGDRMFRQEPMQQYIVRRMMKRYFGMDSRSADAWAKAAREMPERMREQRASAERLLDQQSRDQEAQFDRTWDGLKRQMGKWWDNSVKEPLQKAGAAVAAEVEYMFERFSDKMFGRAAARHRLRGISEEGGRAFRAGQLGDRTEMERVFGRAGDLTGAPRGATALGTFTGGGLEAMGAQARGLGQMFGGGTGLGAALATTGLGAAAAPLVGSQYSTGAMDLMRQMGLRGETVGTEEAGRRLRGGGVVLGGMSIGGLAGLGRGAQVTLYEQEQVRKALGGLQAGVTGRVDTEQAAKDLGFGSLREAQQQMKMAQDSMAQGSYVQQAARHRDATGLRGRAFAESLVRQVEMGKIGDENLKNYLKGASTMQEKVHRMAAAERPDSRGRVGAVDLSEELRKIPGAGAIAARTVEDLAKYQETQEAALAKEATALAGGTTVDRYSREARWAAFVPGLGQALAVTADITRAVRGDRTFEQSDVDKLMRKGGPELEGLIRDLGVSLEDKDREKQIRDAAKNKLQKLSATDKFSPKDRALIDVMTSESPNAQRIVQGMAMGYQKKARMEVDDTLRRRMGRLRESMGDRFEEMQKLTTNSESGVEGRQLGRVVTSLVSMDPNEVKSVEDIQQRLDTVTRLAGKAKPEIVEKLLGQLGDSEAGAMIRTALTEGQTAKGRAKAIIGGQRGAVGEVFGAISTLTGRSIEDIGRLTGGSLRKIQGGDEKLREQLLEGLKGPERKTMEQLLGGIRGKSAEGLEAALTDIGKIRAGTELTGFQKRGDLEKELKETAGGKLFGRMGSSEGMHQQLVNIASILQAIKEQGGPKGTANPQEPPKPAPPQRR